MGVEEQGQCICYTIINKYQVNFNLFSFFKKEEKHKQFTGLFINQTFFFSFFFLMHFNDSKEIRLSSLPHVL